MADISHHQFIALLKKSNVISEKKLQPWLARTTKIDSARKLAKSLVEEELLTTWQAKFLLSGRHRLRIGNYFLLSRLRRDELGARYLAIHASLDRKVELQIFARDLTSDVKRWKSMIQKATLVAKLDHSSLVHVYDIDHDDDRYFLVVEHVHGRSLDVQKEIFTTPQIGQLILQCTEGIEIAHQNQVVHGTIDQADVLLTEKGTVKLQNLTVSPMRNLQNDAPEAKPIADYVALATLGEKLLAANPGTDSGSGVELAAIFALMKTEGASAADKLRQWAEVTPGTDAIGTQPTKSGANPIFSATLDGSSGVDLAKQADVSYRPDVPDENESAVSSASIIRAAKASPAFLVACALGLVMFGGIVAFGLSRAYSKMVVAPAALAVAAEAEADLAAKAKAAKHKRAEEKAFKAWEAKQAEENDSKPPSESVETKRKEKQKNRKSGQPARKDGSQANPDNAQNDKAEPADQEQDAGVNAGAESEAKPDSDPVAEPGKFSDIFGKRKKAEKDAKNEESSGGFVPAPADVEPDDLRRLGDIGPVYKKVLNEAGVITFVQITKMSPAVLDEILAKGKQNKFGKEKWAAIIEEAGSFAQEAAEKAADHFRKIPRTFTLPEIDSTEPRRLAKLVIPSNYLLDVELVSPDGVSPRRSFFELKTSPSDDQTWVVSSKRTKTSSQSNEIATMQKLDEAFTFAWLPAAAKGKSAAFLRNCLVRLSTPDGKSRVVGLREQVEVRALRINGDQLTDTLNVQIQAQPHPDQLRIELGKFSNRERLVEVIDSTVTPDSPGIVALRQRERSGQFLTLQVEVKQTGKSLKLTAGLVFDGAFIKNSSQLAAIKNRIDIFYANTQRQLSLSPKDRELQKANNAAKGSFERMREYEKATKWLFESGGGIGEAINFEIAADFDDAKILLVKSDKNLVEKNKKNKKKKK